MIIATIVNSKRFRTYEYLCALSICVGLMLFAMADYSLDPLEFHPAGLLLVGGSVVADAVLPNAQERLFMDGSSRLEVTVYSNFFIFVGMTTATLANGTLPRFLGVVARDGTLALYFGTYAVLSYISISCYMTLVKRFGGVTHDPINARHRLERARTAHRQKKEPKPLTPIVSPGFRVTNFCFLFF